MQVLLSIKPEFADKIFDGTKKFEYRKAIFSRKDIQTIVVYASSPVSKIIGEFEIARVHHESVSVLWEKTKADAGISQQYFLKYFANKDKGYAIEIKTVRAYPTPLSLDMLTASTPPQSFMYVEKATTIDSVNSTNANKKRHIASSAIGRLFYLDGLGICQV